MTDQREKAARFAAMHRQGCFVLPTCWDMASAALCLEAGFEAIGTSSIAVALSHGLRDGEALGRDRMIAVAGGIARNLSCPVSADLEAGYGATPEAVAETVRRAIAAGLVGANIEDSDPADHSLLDPALAAARIAAAVAAAREAGLPDFVVNARADPFFRGMPADEALPEAVRRANAYLAAGATCAFVPGPADGATAAALAARIDGPLNLMAGGREPTASLAELAAAGVRRISLGGSLMGAACAGIVAALRGIREEGSFAYAGPAREPFRDLVRCIYRQTGEADA